MATIIHIISPKRTRFFIALALLSGLNPTFGQVCTDPVNVIYGLTNSGNLHPINVNTGVAGPAINPAYTGNTPSQSNGVGYNTVNGKFYYFKRLPSDAPTEFVSFDPATNAVTILSTPVTTNAVYVGSITPDGTGYYCWDSQARLFYYNIASDTWTMITTSMVDQFGKDVDSILRAHGSGDAAIDGNGNFVMLPSSNTRYGVFTLNAPLPTTPVASVNVTQVLAMNPPPAKFVGIALNSTGQIFLSTSTDRLYRLENDLSLTLISTLSLNMGDLTSCNFPMAILPASHKNFNAVLLSKEVNISWKASEENTAKTYSVEHSTNTIDWRTITTVSGMKYGSEKISFIHNAPERGKNYYRLRMESSGNKITYSQMRVIDFNNRISFASWPNPVKNNLFIQNDAKENSNSLLLIFDQAGNKIKGARLSEGINNIDIKSLFPGQYFVSIRSSNGENFSYKVVKN